MRLGNPISKDNASQSSTVNVDLYEQVYGSNDRKRSRPTSSSLDFKPEAGEKHLTTPVKRKSAKDKRNQYPQDNRAKRNEIATRSRSSGIPPPKLDISDLEGLTENEILQALYDDPELAVAADAAAKAKQKRESKTSSAKSGAGASSSSSSSSKYYRDSKGTVKSKTQHPEHLKDMMDGGIPITQWVVVVLILLASLYQLRNLLVVPSQITTTRKIVGKKKSAESKTNGRKNNKNKAKKNSQNGARAKANSFRPRPTTEAKEENRHMKDIIKVDKVAKVSRVKTGSIVQKAPFLPTTEIQTSKKSKNKKTKDKISAVEVSTITQKEVGKRVQKTDSLDHISTESSNSTEAENPIPKKNAAPVTIVENPISDSVSTSATVAGDCISNLVSASTIMVETPISDSDLNPTSATEASISNVDSTSTIVDETSLSHSISTSSTVVDTPVFLASENSEYNTIDTLLAPLHSDTVQEVGDDGWQIVTKSRGVASSKQKKNQLDSANESELKQIPMGEPKKAHKQLNLGKIPVGSVPSDIPDAEGAKESGKKSEYNSVRNESKNEKNPAVVSLKERQKSNSAKTVDVVALKEPATEQVDATKEAQVRVVEKVEGEEIKLSASAKEKPNTKKDAKKKQQPQSIGSQPSEAEVKNKAGSNSEPTRGESDKGETNMEKSLSGEQLNDSEKSIDVAKAASTKVGIPAVDDEALAKLLQQEEENMVEAERQANQPPEVWEEVTSKKKRR